IDVGGVNGIVRRINIRSTQVETFDNAVIFVPNAEFLSGKLTNWTRNGRMVRQEVAVGVAYGSDIQLVEKLLKQVAKEHQKVLTYPEPVVLFNDFAASSLDFRLRFWVGDILHGSGIASDIRKVIDAKFTEANIEISFPQMDVHLRENETVPVELRNPRKVKSQPQQEDRAMLRQNG
ncbi:MAG: mechanosensitive ion channel family protein, partial [Bilophila wadsworthia]